MKRQYCGKLGSGISRNSRWALYVVSMACLWGMVAAQAAAPPMSPPANCEGSSRDLVSTVWGFILTCVALSLDDWGILKNAADDYFWKVALVCVWGSLNPLTSLTNKLDYVVRSWTMRRRLSTTREARSYIRTLVSCKVVVHLSATAYNGDFKGKLKNFHEEVDVADFSDALVLGTEVPDWKDTIVQLSAIGKEMLIKSGVLPPIDRLKILQGSSGLAVAVSAAQGVGYVYGVVVRVVQGRRVSPIEVVGFYLSIMILVRAMFHSFVSSCHRPLVIFLNDGKEQEFIMKCEKCDENAYVLYARKLRSYLGEGLVSLFFCSVLVLFLIYDLRSTPLTLVVPLIMLIISSSPLLVVIEYCSNNFKSFSNIGSYIAVWVYPISYIVAYVYSLVLTWKYWKSFEFDVPTSGYLSKILPYIG
ncbi:hypothetical protein KC19_8G043600 [Ceratodon purpureus]|uniref:Uncharacterized protein n=1 Tax=Ceratodon purpureus TaxID=3225 RepID=A0A8T0H3B9_CERPU|nr:hypothetical protein KC19_8G043600 [Ceratodon purpureus]